MTKQRIHSVIVIICLAVFIAAGCYYAYARDLYNGCNKIYVTPGEQTGQVACTEVMTQGFVPGHDFDGVSFLLDHNRAADFGRVTVDVYRSATGEMVLSRTVPVITISGARYTYFASNETIEAEPAEGFHAVIRYEGPAAGLVTAATGAMPEYVAGVYQTGSVPSDTSLALGVVTDYHRDVQDMLLTVAAVAMMAVAVAVFYWGRRSMRANTRCGKVLFLIGYYGTITALLLYSFTLTREYDYNEIALDGASAVAGNADDAEMVDVEENIALDEIGLRDDGTLDAFITLPVDYICGIDIPVEIPDAAEGYAYSNESVTVQVRQAGTNYVLQTETYEVRHIHNSIRATDSIYVALDDRYDAGTRLVLHISTQGMAYENGLGFQVAPIGESGNSLYVTGNAQGGQLYGTLCQAVEARNYGHIWYFYGGAVLIGAVAAWVMFRRGWQLWEAMPSESQRSRLAKLDRPVIVNVSRKRLIAWMLFTILFGVIAIDSSYNTVRRAQNCIWPEWASHSADGRYTWVEIPSDDEITQSLTTDLERFGGIALMLSADGIDISNVEDAKATLHVRIEDANNNVIDDSLYDAADLGYMRSVVVDDYYMSGQQSLPYGFYYLPCGEDLNIPAGTELTVYISTSVDRTDSIYIGENDYGQAHLLAAYKSYTITPYIYWPVMIVLLVIACVLATNAICSIGRPLTLCVIMVALIGVCMNCLMPVNFAGDEMAHIESIYEMSNTISGTYRVAGPGRMRIAAEGLRDLRYTYPDHTILDYNMVISDFLQGRASYDGIDAIVGLKNAMRQQNIWLYLPAIIGFQLMRMLGMACWVCVIVARLCNFAVSLTFIYVGIRKCPYGRNGMMIVLLFPLLIQQIASCSYDSMMIGMMFLFVGCCLHVIVSGYRTVAEMICVAIPLMILCVTKSGVYLPILCVALVPLIRRIMHSSRTCKVSVALGGIAIGLAVIVGYASRAYVGEEFYSISYFVLHPIAFLHIVEYTILDKGDGLLATMIGNNALGNDISFPTFLAFVVCVIWYLAWQNDKDLSKTMNQHMARLLAMLAVLGSLLPFLAFAIAETMIGRTTIRGLSGKYLMPYAMFLSTVAGVYVPSGHRISQERILYYMGLIYLWVFNILIFSRFGYGPIIIG